MRRLRRRRPAPPGCFVLRARVCACVRVCAAPVVTLESRRSESRVRDARRVLTKPDAELWLSTSSGRSTDRMGDCMGELWSPFLHRRKLPWYLIDVISPARWCGRLRGLPAGGPPRSSPQCRNRASRSQTAG
eukprot:3849787-Pyramimonas_sp.AAC.1